MPPPLARKSGRLKPLLEPDPGWERSLSNLLGYARRENSSKPVGFHPEWGVV